MPGPATDRQSHALKKDRHIDRQALACDPTPHTPEVSVCVPVYNGAAFIAETLRSILAQTFADFEVIVTDNCSTDDTTVIVRRFSDPRLRLLMNETNLGAVGNFNRALMEARGRRVKLVCADDVLMPTCLEEQLAALDSCPGAVMICSARRIIDQSGRSWVVRRFPGPSGRLPGRQAIAKALRTGTNPFGEPAAVLMDRQALQRAGGFSEQWRFCVDLDLWCRMLEHGDAVIQKIPLCEFRVSPDSWSSRLVANQSHEFIRFAGETAGRLPGLLTDRELRIAGVRSRLLARTRAVFYRVLSLFPSRSF